jgi:hypothetical protein
MRQGVLAFALACALAGCAVHGTVPGEVAVGTPGVVIPPTVSVWRWWPWPHYEVVDHCGGCDWKHGKGHDRGKHKGWYKHQRSDDD